SDAFKAAVADCMEQAGFVAEAAETEAETESESAAEAENTDADESDTEFAAAADAPFIPGTYTATAQGMESEITVNVTFDEYNIVAVGTWLEGETAGVGADIGEEISNQILEAQSADVDGVSGATVTSTAVREAVAACIEQAKADNEDTVTTESETENITEEITEAETEDITEEVTEAETEEITEEASLSSLYSAGVYTASAAGISSDVIVTVSFDDNSITAIGYDLSGETADIGALIGPEISGQILTAQSAEVDGVSGATVTSDAFKAAVEDCIAQAQAGSSDLVIIGGSDGPTSIFLAGTVSEDETEQPETEGAE
ncbi:MAG: FMN-binding protein, partial [Lachnospiraceae bacterium]|nr:FMN-binding protein [Lachnospiraceae bacterium]